MIRGGRFILQNIQCERNEDDLKTILSLLMSAESTHTCEVLLGKDFLWIFILSFLPVCVCVHLSFPRNSWVEPSVYVGVSSWLRRNRTFNCRREKGRSGASSQTPQTVQKLAALSISLSHTVTHRLSERHACKKETDTWKM